VPTWNIYMGEGRETFLIDYTNPSSNQSQSMMVDASILDVDFNKKTYLIHFILKPNGSLVNSQGQLTYDTVLSISPSQQKYIYHAGETFISLQVQLHYDDGNPIDYPFDRYTGLNLKIITARSTTTLGFSIFMCLLMWALSLVMAIFGYQVLFHRRSVDVHACMLGITMLFALPALRSAQPGIPDVGCISDVLGFYWNMAIIALVSITMLACWIARWGPDEEKQPTHITTTDSKMTSVQHIERFDP
ncbi:hypothetical protein BC941DRAFT_349528, partial [Chlamydoabsidia padenii]